MLWTSPLITYHVRCFRSLLFFVIHELYTHSLLVALVTKASAVEWLTDYLKGLTHQTVLIVSHDTAFLENVVSDVIHYEQRPVWGPYRRLVHYKGKMSDFVKLQPQAKHYFELATTDNLNFNFPEPGRLEGVKTSTQKFLEMEHVDFRYPGAKENTLTDINLKMSLSSRVVVLGANGRYR